MTPCGDGRPEHAIVVVDAHEADEGRPLAPPEQGCAPSGTPVLTPEIVVQVLHIEHAQRWHQRREMVMVTLPRAVLGRRVADGLRAVPVRYAVLAFVGLLVLRDIGVRGAVAVTLWGVVMGAAIGVALMKGHDR